MYIVHASGALRGAASKRKATVQSDKPAKEKPTYDKKVSSTKVVTSQMSASYMSPFGKHFPPQNYNSLGNCVTAPLMSRFTVSTSTTESIVVVFSPSNRTIFQVGIWSVAGALQGDGQPNGNTAKDTGE